MVLRILYRAHVLSTTIGKVKFYRTSSALLKTVQFNLSDIGEGIREVTVREWSVKVGDLVAQFDNICSVESDKATVSITSRYDGTVTKLYYKVGEVALVGKPLVDIDVKESQNVSVSESTNSSSEIPKLQKLPDKFVNAEQERKQVAYEKNVKVEHDSHYVNKTLATPAVRRIAKENDILLSKVAATGKGGRVLKEDILQHIENMMDDTVGTQDKVSSDGITTIEQHEKTIKIAGIKKVMVKTMTKSHAIPTFGYCDEINMSKLVDLQQEVKQQAELKSKNITFMPFFIKALSKALNEYPLLNASVDENCENIIYKSSHNVGVAMDTKEGLIVPNIKNVEKLTVSEIAIQLKRLLEDGRDLRLLPSDMTGGTITISNIGIIGGTYARPLILPPEVCIVAVGKTRLVPAITENGEIIKTYQMAASWTADHRIIDGATMAKFSNIWKKYLENPSYLLLDL